MNYEWKCPDCKKRTSGSTTGIYCFQDEIECSWCGRISIISNITSHFQVEQTEKRISPTELQKLEQLQMKIKNE